MTFTDLRGFQNLPGLGTKSRTADKMDEMISLIFAISMKSKKSLKSVGQRKFRTADKMDEMICQWKTRDVF